jgi:ketosteroid isomerase-like protein
MPRQPLPAVAAVLSFVDCINRGDLDGLAELMTDDHVLRVLDEDPVAGRDANVEAWHGYLSSFPSYVIYPRYVASSGDTVAVLGATTGSHLALAEEDELAINVVWVATVVDGTLSSWHVADDGPAVRACAGIPASV